MILRSRYLTLYEKNRYWAVHKKMGGAMYPGRTQEVAILKARKAYALYKKVGWEKFYDMDLHEEFLHDR